jgi:hypothetical protein
MPPPPEVPDGWGIDEFEKDNDSELRGDLSDVPGGAENIESSITDSDGNRTGLTEQSSADEIDLPDGSKTPELSELVAAPKTQPTIEDDETREIQIEKKTPLPRENSIEDPSLPPVQLSQGNIERSLQLPPYLVSPNPVVDGEQGEIRMVTVVVRSTGDKMRDVLRLRRIHGIVTTYPGEDRFAFHVFERGRGYLLEFPNFTAGLCDELLQRLGDLVGSENVRVERITFQ